MAITTDERRKKVRDITNFLSSLIVAQYFRSLGERIIVLLFVVDFESFNGSVGKSDSERL